MFLKSFSLPKHCIPVSLVATIPSITHSQVFWQRISPHLAALLVPFLQNRTLNIEDLGRSQFGILESPLMALFLPFIPLALEGLSEVMKRRGWWVLLYQSLWDRGNIVAEERDGKRRRNDRRWRYVCLRERDNYQIGVCQLIAATTKLQTISSCSTPGCNKIGQCQPLHTDVLIWLILWYKIAWDVTHEARW